jgi:hypothetical protein
LSDFNEDWIFVTGLKTQVSDSTEFRPEEAALLHADKKKTGQMEGGRNEADWRLSPV